MWNGHAHRCCEQDRSSVMAEQQPEERVLSAPWSSNVIDAAANIGRRAASTSVRPLSRDLSGVLPSIRPEVRCGEKGEEQNSGGATADSGARLEGQVEERRQSKEESSGECAISNGGDRRPARPPPTPPTRGTGRHAGSEVQRDQHWWVVGRADQSQKHLRQIDDSEDSKDHTEDEHERFARQLKNLESR